MKIHKIKAMVNEVYVALGGNQENTPQIFQNALLDLQTLGADFACSRFYLTPPLSNIPQKRFLNAVCRFKTSLSPQTLLDALQQIEKKYGKHPKPKNMPRPFDLDMLFFGNIAINSAFLDIPHPRWKERLFVLIPLSDLTAEVALLNTRVSIQPLIDAFPASEKNAIICINNPQEAIL